MKPYDRQARCPKCGERKIAARWNKGITSEAAKFIGCGIEPEPEHMIRTCTRCGYRWHESPMDFKPGSEAK